MYMQRNLLLTSAAVLALGVGMPSDAQAFDSVNWEWNKTVDVEETIIIDVNDEFDLSGLTEVEKLQLNIGNVTAEAQLNDIDNNPPSEAGDGSFSGTVNIDVDYETSGTGVYNPVNETLNFGGDIQGVTLDSAALTVDTAVNPDAESDNLSLTITGQVDTDGVSINDAIDLPRVDNAATAVANNQSIDSTVAVQLHDAQYNFGGFAADGPIDPGQISPESLENGALIFGASDQTDNFYTDAAVALTLAGAMGIITQGEVSATAVVDSDLPGSEGNLSVHNAIVDNAATAVGNNLSVALDASTPGDAFLVADITQFNYANVDAYAEVDDVAIDNYTGFGAAGLGPCGGCLEGDEITSLVSNVATAVGNNASISVSNAVDVQIP